ncbi:tetratricopeptide repeat-containing sensor histidine kinase [Lacinutrix sp. MEBiC02595]
MRYLVKSFLFFFVFFQIISTTKIYAQKSIDSSSYYVNLINKPKLNEDLVIGLGYFQNKKIKNLHADNKLAVVYNLIFIARAEKKIGVLYDSENSAIEALKLLDQLDENGYNKYRISLYNHLGVISKELYKYSIALDYFRKVLAIENRPKEIATVLNNMGNVYKEKKEYVVAINYYKEAYTKSVIIKDRLNQARVLDNLGVVQSKLDLPEALGNINKGLQIRIDKKFKQGIISSYSSLSEYYKNRKDRVNALLYADKALDIANFTKNIDYIISALGNKMSINEDMGVLTYKRLTDSVNASKEKIKNRYAVEKYNYDKKSGELKINKIKRQNDQILFFIGLLFLLLCTTFLYFILRAKHKKEKLSQVYNTETRISKKVHDEVANDVYQVMTKLQNHTYLNEDVLDDLEDIYTKTRDISKESSAINMEQDFKDAITDLLLSYKSNTVNVITKGISTVDWQSLSAIKKVAIYRVLQELMTNMKKHSGASIVVLVFHKENKKISINYKDNGVGCILKKYNGLQNTENRIETINGTITFDSSTNNGFKANIII